MQRIAIFRALYLGDMLCIIPTVRAIRNSYPHAEIFLIGLPWQKDFVCRFSDYFDEFIEFPGWPGLPEQIPVAEKIIRFLDKMRSYKFDLVLQMQGNGEITNCLCMLWDAKKVCGLRKAGEYAPLEAMFPISPDSDHEILRFLKLLDCLQIKHDGTHLEFPITEHEQRRTLELLQQKKIQPREYICIHAGARDVRRRWPVENFAYLADHLAHRCEAIVLTGSEDERALLEALQTKIHMPVLNVVEAFGHLNAGELAALIKYSRLVVSNDTGVSHIASAVETPSVIVFSQYSDINRWRPLTDMNIAIPFERSQNRERVLETAIELLSATADGAFEHER